MALTKQGNLYSMRFAAYSVVIAASDADEATATFRAWLAERGVSNPALGFPKKTRSIGERLLLIASDGKPRYLDPTPVEGERDPHGRPSWRVEEVEVEVTGWDRDNESISWSGRGATEDEAISDACKRGGIVEIGDTTIIRGRA